MPGTVLDKEMETFERHKAELVGRARGEYVLIKDDRIVDTFENEWDAIKRGYKEFGVVPFLVKEVVESERPILFTTVWTRG